MTNKKKENKINYDFTPVNTAYRCSGLKPLEILIMSTLDGYRNNGMECWVSDETFAGWYGVDRKTVSRAIGNLEEKGYIVRETKVVKDNGQATRQRKLWHGDKWHSNVWSRSMFRD